MRWVLLLPLALTCAVASSALAQVSRDTTRADSTRADSTRADTTAIDTTAAAAPEDTTEAYSAPWRTSYFPYLTGAANDGPVLAARVRYSQPAAYEARTTSTASLSFDAGISGRGSRFVTGLFRAPGLWKNWRLGVLASADRQARYGYFGLGENTIYDKNLRSDSIPVPLPRAAHPVPWRSGADPSDPRAVHGCLPAQRGAGAIHLAARTVGIHRRCAVR